MMKNNTYILLATVFILLIGRNNAKAQQDIHFSQFYAAPITINPATAGMFNGDFRAHTNYRNQWASVSTPFKTMSLSADAAFGKTGTGGFLGGGINFFSDKAGDAELSTNKFNLTVAYALKVGKDAYFSMGIQGGYLQRSIESSGLYWDNQFTGSGFNQSLSSGEASASNKENAIDLAAGGYFFSSPSSHMRLYAGAAVYHLTSPDVSFDNTTDDKIHRKYTFHAGAEIGVANKNIAFLPAALVMFQGPNQMINFGADVKYLLQESSQHTGYFNETSFQLGGYFRLNDAFYTALTFNYSGVSVGVSYDFNLSGLRSASNGMGGFELMLSYRSFLFSSGGNTSVRFM